ncbi:uncharacterized protein LOC143280182 [Babylonia areolata]|uniref:uncharacterized protein LOC143280182 n=1 Tax=Babylonia areolata TaxID=304850 RepID=UPI003FD05D12
MDRRDYNSGYSILGAPISLRNFRRDYDDDNDGYGLAAAAFPAHHHHHHHHDLHEPEPHDVDTSPRDVDSDDDTFDRGRKRRFHSTSSSSQSPYRSCKSSVSPGNSASESDEARELSEELDGEETSTRAHTQTEKERISEKEQHNFSNDRAESCRSASKPKKAVCLIHDNEEDEDEGWKELPAILLEDIFVLLSPKHRHQASMVCRPWYEIFYSPRVWETFVLFETTLTRRRFSAYKGYQRELCPGKTQLCLMRVGCFFKRIVVTPISDYYSLYEFLRVLAAYLGLNSDSMPLLHTFRFTFACESRGMNGVVIIGTGGNILRKVKELVSNLQQLRHLALNQLLLDVGEVPGLLEAAATHCTHTLLSLELLNCSKVPLPIPEVVQFTHLVKLKVSAQHLSEEMLLLLGGTPKLTQLHVVQDAHTCTCQPVSGAAWKLFKDMAPAKRVFLEVQGLTKTPLLLQPHAPVRGVVFRTPYHRLTPDLATWLLEYYGPCLEYFVQERLPRAHGSRRFGERADESFLRLVRACPRLHTLVIRERISLATLLLLAQEGGRRLRVFIVRKNALLKKCEWPRAKNWSPEFHQWLRRHGRNYELAFEEMPVLLGQRWKPTVDRSFKHLMMHVT